jgi:hypothetical protein
MQKNIVADFGTSRPSRFFDFLKVVSRKFGKTFGQGAATSVYCATAPELKTNGITHFKSINYLNMNIRFV